VYADWLEERGDARHEFLRAESRLADLEPGDQSYAVLKRNVTRLRKALATDWLRQLDDARQRSGREATNCHECGRRLTAKEAIALHPRTRKKLKTRRYCSSCWENAVRNEMREAFSRDLFDPNSVVDD
jgi:hypothetical protein